MSRSAQKLAALEKRLPAGICLPPEFAAFVRLVTSERSPHQDTLRVAWSDPSKPLNVEKAVRRHLFPFLLLADGGGIALWQDGANLRVVYFASDGSHGVLALSFREFIARVGKPSKAFKERLELDDVVDVGPIIPPTKPRAVPAALNRRLSAWLDSHSLSAQPLSSPGVQKLRKQLVNIARSMLADKLSSVYQTRDVHWSMDYRLVKTGGNWHATYLDYGRWHVVPVKYRLVELLPSLLPLMKQRKARYELLVVKDGHVYANGGNQLVLAP